MDTTAPPAWIRRLAGDPVGTGIFCDFDGTLAPIVDDPARARPLPEVVTVLAGLARHYGRVGVISGRPGAFLASWFDGIPGLVLSGLYGLETVTDGTVSPHPDAEMWRAVVEAAASRADEKAPPGLVVERKGLSVTIHFRTAPALEQVAHEWVQAEAATTGLIVHAARMSYELLPPIAATKGTVLLQAATAADLDQLCFVGDDLADLDAFDALDQLSAAGRFTVRVAVLSPETPPGLIERADASVEGPEGVIGLLNQLLVG